MALNFSAPARSTSVRCPGAFTVCKLKTASSRVEGCPFGSTPTSSMSSLLGCLASANINGNLDTSLLGIEAIITQPTKTSPMQEEIATTVENLYFPTRAGAAASLVSMVQPPH